MSMVTSSTWVPRGYAAPFPTKQDFDEDEFERIAAMAKLQLDDAQDDLDEAEAQAASGKAAKASAKADAAAELVPPIEHPMRRLRPLTIAAAA